jgi:hypothetical protein
VSIAIAETVVDRNSEKGHPAPMDQRSDHRSDLRRALVEIDAATRENVTRSTEIQARVMAMRAAIDDDVPILEAITREPRPLVVELITANIEALQTIGSKVRQAEARALRAEGLTMEAIAALFGVSRQRISALLRQGNGD